MSKQEQIRQRLIKARIALGLTQAEAADAMGLHRNTIIKLESGDIACRLQTIKKLCRFYKIKIESLIL